MFDWLSGKKDPANLALTDEQHKSLNDMAEALASDPKFRGVEVSPELVLKQLLGGELSLMSSRAKAQIAMTPEGVKITDPAAVASGMATDPSQPEAAEVPEAPGDGNSPLAAPPVAADATPELAPTSQDAGDVAFLRQQLEAMQTRLNQRRDQQAAHQAKMTALMRKSQQQQQEIETLKAQVDELRQAAAIGQAQLNRWKFNNFSR